MTDRGFAQLRSSIRDGLDLTSVMSDEHLMGYIESKVLEADLPSPLTAAEKRVWVKRLYDSFRGLDVLQPLVDDKSVSEIMINSHEEIFVERGGVVLREALRFESREKLEDIIQTIVSGVNRVVNDSSPIVDARLKDGSRVNVVLPPIALKGPTMTIRKFPEQPLTMENLVEWGALSEEAAFFLQDLVKGKYNIFISGGTGSGKTTFLNALSQFIPQEERVITIEDSAELRINSVPNLVSLETRNANTEGKGEITVKELIRTSLRMRPNRIVVGEVRGSEALDMLQAMNTGHEGSLSTGHANSTRDMISRLETMVLSGADLPIQVVRQQISSAIDIFVHLSRLRDRSRRVVEITEVVGLLDGEVILNPLFVFEEHGEQEDRIRGRLVRRGVLRNIEKLVMAGIVRGSKERSAMERVISKPI